MQTNKMCLGEEAGERIVPSAGRRGESGFCGLGDFLPGGFCGAVAAVALLAWIFSKVTAKPAFKIFGVFYIGAVMLMTCVAAGRLFTAPSAHTAVFCVGALSFLVSDIVLILNTFGKTTKQSLRVLNLCLYYLGQLLIGLSLMLPGV